MAKDRKSIKKLAEILSQAKNSNEMEQILEDFLTSSELQALLERWDTVEALLQGHSQREVARRTGVSISKVTRAAQVLREGVGGFELLWKRKKPTR